MTRRFAATVVTASILLILIASGAFVVTTLQLRAARADNAVVAHELKLFDEKKEQDAADAKIAADAAKRVADAETAAADLRAKNDAKAYKAGYSNSPDDPDVYWRASQGTCSSYLPCSHLQVMVAKACPNGVYIAANLESGAGVVMGYGNDITGALTSGKSAAVEIVFASSADGASSSEVTDAHCL